MISEGGFDTMPYIVSRYVTGPRETYGRSPAMTILPDIKMINEMSKTVIRAGQKVVDPPLLVADEGVMFPINTNAGQVDTFPNLGRDTDHDGDRGVATRTRKGCFVGSDHWSAANRDAGAAH